MISEEPELQGKRLRPLNQNFSFFDKEARIVSPTPLVEVREEFSLPIFSTPERLKSAVKKSVRRSDLLALLEREKVT